MTHTPTYAHPLRVAALPKSRATEFSLRPDAETLTEIRDALGVQDVRKVSFTGEVAPRGARDWVLTARLGATVIQPCVATLVPVTTRIDRPILRTYSPDFVAPEAAEAEMPEDDTVEPLGKEIDPGLVMVEALTLALPDYPRAPDAGPADASALPPGAQPIKDEETKPFAGLKDLREKLANDNTDESE